VRANFLWTASVQSALICPPPRYVPLWGWFAEVRCAPFIVKIVSPFVLPASLPGVPAEHLNASLSLEQELSSSPLRAVFLVFVSPADNPLWPYLNYNNATLVFQKNIVPVVAILNSVHRRKELALRSLSQHRVSPTQHFERWHVSF